MSVLITVKVNGDTAKFRDAVVARADEFAAIGEKGRASGAIHHRFGIGDGFVVVSDEWESVEAFQVFFTDPAMQEFVRAVGGDTSAPPEIIVAEALRSADEF
jgi:quinol monooxygenase YgiN